MPGSPTVSCSSATSPPTRPSPARIGATRSKVKIPLPKRGRSTSEARQREGGRVGVKTARAYLTRMRPHRASHRRDTMKQQLGIALATLLIAGLAAVQAQQTQTPPLKIDKVKDNLFVIS